MGAPLPTLATAPAEETTSHRRARSVRASARRWLRQAATKIALLLQQLIAPLVNQHHHNDTEPVPLNCIVMSMSGYGRRKDALVLEKAVVDSGLAKHCIVAGDTAGPLECLKSWITTQPTQLTRHKLV